MHHSQPNTRTIEGTLFNALVAAGAISADNADDPVKVNLQRDARTDAGVHAAGNVVSLKVITSIPGIPDFVARVNEELPPEIRLWSFVCHQEDNIGNGLQVFLIAKSTEFIQRPVVCIQIIFPFCTNLLNCLTDPAIVGSILTISLLTCLSHQNQTVHLLDHLLNSLKAVPQTL